jgi:hypothetical protein
MTSNQHLQRTHANYPATPLHDLGAMLAADMDIARLLLQLVGYAI